MTNPTSERIELHNPDVSQRIDLNVSRITKTAWQRHLMMLTAREYYLAQECEGVCPKSALTILLGYADRVEVLP